MKTLSKKIGLFCGWALCAMVLFTTADFTVCASEEVTAVENESRSTNYTWYYKEIDGVMYMRLWNHETQQWVGDWIPVP